MICFCCDRKCDPKYKPYAGGYCSEECWYQDGCPTAATVRGMILERSEKEVEELDDSSDIEEDVTSLISRWNDENK